MTRSEMDASSKEGAQRLARTIEDYWKRRGGIVRTWIEPVHQSRTAGGPREPHYAVKTDMLNGLPIRWETA